MPTSIRIPGTLSNSPPLGSSSAGRPQGTAAGTASAYSRPAKAKNRSCHARQVASATIRRDILDFPARRCSNTKGTSTNGKPARHARNLSSI